MLQGILYCSPDASTALVDLPTSIASAQASSRHLRSTAPPHQPHQTPEPKGEKRNQLLASIAVAELETHGLIQSTLQTGLSTIRNNWHAPRWCLDRHPVTPDPHGPSGSPYQTCSNINVESSDYAPPLILSSILNIVNVLDDLNDIVVCNTASTTSELKVPGLGKFYIPPHSAFLHSTIERGHLAFESAIKCNLLGEDEEQHSEILTFDLVLLDPPWTNRSVRHSRAYMSAELQQSDPFQQAISILEKYLDTTGYVAIWITNKSKIRSEVIQEFSKLNLRLLEEWIWLKTTDVGDPVTPLDGIWRKPYESLLLFSRRSEPVELTQRTIVAVPDLHSRKPCLKSFFEVFMPANYRALELFARSLTANWWSWGNEVLKFQHEQNWT